MTKRLKHNLSTWLMYAVVIYIVLIPFQIWFTGISVSLLLGFFFGVLNDILTQLRMLNGEKFENLEE